MEPDPLRIHIVTDKFNTGGGIEHVYQISKGIKNVNFGIFAENGNAKDKFKGLDNIKVYDKGFSPEYVLEKRPDIVHIHHLRPLLSFFKNPFAKYNIPIIFTAHGLHIHKYEFSKSLGKRLKYFLRFNLEKNVFKKIDRVIAVSKEDTIFLQDKYKLKNVTYLTNGIDFSRINISNKSKIDLRKDMNLCVDHFLFLTVARFDYQKGYDVLIRAIYLLKDFIKNRKVKFIFVGKGDKFEEMKKLSEKLSVSEYIYFFGERKDVYNIIKCSDCFILPSRWEGLPIVLIEAGFLKVPVIASNTYGNREIIRKKNGFLFENQNIEDLSENIKKIIEHKNYLDEYSENLFQEVKKNYSIENMISGIKQIYFSYKKY